MLTFLSHSHKDKAVYTLLTTALDNAGVKRWDPESMSVGESVPRQLQSAIQNCSVCVLLATQRSVKSPWCLAEVGAFWGTGKKVLMFIADADLDATTLPPQFKDTLRTDNARELLDELKKENSPSLALTDEETVIRRFYAGISEGINGNDAGWNQAWNQCAEKQRKRYIALRPEVPSDAPAKLILAPLYEDSSNHEVLHISQHQRVSTSQAVYLVMYKERKETLPSRLHFKFFDDPDVTAAKFYSMFPDQQAVFDCIVNDIGSYYQFESKAKKYGDLSEDSLKDEIKREVESLSLKRIFGGNLIFELGTLFQLKRKEEKTGLYKSEGAPRPFDIGYVLNVHLQKESGQWRITRFEPNSTIYVNVLK